MASACNAQAHDETLLTRLDHLDLASSFSSPRAYFCLLSSATRDGKSTVKNVLCSGCLQNLVYWEVHGPVCAIEDSLLSSEYLGKGQGFWPDPLEELTTCDAGEGRGCTKTRVIKANCPQQQKSSVPTDDCPRIFAVQISVLPIGIHSLISLGLMS